MASLLRQLVAGPRSRHPEAGLDLCYVTDQIIATSGPSGTYPQRAYRNPLDQLVKFLDYKHGEDWAIWEFRAEGTGYPDSEVYGRVWHYPWPDHHPPPFRLVPMIMAGMRNWLHETDGDEAQAEDRAEVKDAKKGEKKKRVVVVHCKAGKGRSGTMACSYLISECGWKPDEALARFTERRMRPGFGQGVSIPSQLRWVAYVDRWTNSKKIYVERQIEIMEVHVWGLRDGVKVQVEGFVDEGKTIKLFHVFTKKERVIVEGNTPGGGGIRDKISDMAGLQNEGKVAETNSAHTSISKIPTTPQAAGTSSSGSTTTEIIGTESGPTTAEITGTESGGSAVIFKPSTRVVLPSSDVNIAFERRNKASMGWTMVTAVAHVWFNCYFEGNGPEQGGKPDENGVFEIEWDKMDGIKGSSRKGARAFDKMTVVWKAYDPSPSEGKKEDVVTEPGLGSPVPQVAPANWKGGNDTSPDLGKDLGLRTESPRSVEVSKASSMKSGTPNDDNDSEEGVKRSSQEGEENIGADDIDVKSLPQAQANGSEPTVSQVNRGLDTASKTTSNQTTNQTASQGLSACEAVTAPPPTDPSAGKAATTATSSLPDGVPEDQLRDAKTHGLGHLQSSAIRQYRAEPYAETEAGADRLDCEEENV
ncbi:dual specificity phosphatase [Drepanopeziza brunnea f. sp. 'multigermtubi' MB_m1]|uniref:phosphatidylinositol-3,4,5-trisphosphate 3-phosphatase n=1 Tax=Marssonina brunnea f. sp. multigermtubi (strain MB_m1) TaxID=1072389 RepID=K1Y0M9_MARBU|nr:dual specificity phosphatase [Drepanopeziza brunnea f. sp. 'multigermtubi' MB_m1]EKD18639.1 dual specificity phosphatase [Drepanopeziza brunnea f. sp. 'multigermtubi' MB_m1]